MERVKAHQVKQGQCVVLQLKSDNTIVPALTETPTDGGIFCVISTTKRVSATRTAANKRTTTIEYVITAACVKSLSPATVGEGTITITLGAQKQLLRTPDPR